MEKKICFKCGETKSIADFYAHPKMSDGHLGKCKICTKKDVRTNYKNHHAHFIRYELERNKTEKRKAQHTTLTINQRSKYPDRYRANTAVGNAIRDGELTKKPCEVCGQAKVEAHHDDYSKPLDVRWLCHYHHREHHGRLAIG